MITAEPFVAGAGAREEAKAYLRIAGSDEDALIDRLLAAAGGLCEQFTGQMLLTRGVIETLAAAPGWRRLARAPVAAITAVEALPANGGAAALLAEAPVAAIPLVEALVAAAGAAALAPETYGIDIDSAGTGWVRIVAPGAMRVRVTYSAGLAYSWETAPEGLRFGVVRLAAHLYAHRDGAGGGGPPAAVTALWRPWRMMTLGGGGRLAG
jgi:uncharacterized phiE125 gp8 family phage protein